MERLGFVNYFIHKNQCTSVYVIGDMNADLSDGQSLFAKHMLQFCDDNKLKISNQLLLPADSYSYISEPWHTTSWLDHCISTADAHAAVQSMEILYGASMTHHVPIAMTLEVESLPELSHEVNSGCSAYLDWSKLTNYDLSSYYMKTDVALSNICIPRDAIMCSDVGCKDISHSKSLCDMYDCIVEVMV